jgi:hypothetical protein
MLGRLSKDSPSVQPFCNHMRANGKTFLNVSRDLLSASVLPGSGHAQRSAMHAKSFVALGSTRCGKTQVIPGRADEPHWQSVGRQLVTARRRSMINKHGEAVWRRGIAWKSPIGFDIIAPKRLSNRQYKLSNLGTDKLQRRCGEVVSCAKLCC